MAGVLPGRRDGPAKSWLRVFIGPDTVCFVMDPTRSGEVLARHAGLDKKTGQLLPHEDGGPRRLVPSTDFYRVYESAGNKAEALVNLYCLAHVRRHLSGRATRTRSGCGTGRRSGWTGSGLSAVPMTS